MIKKTEAKMVACDICGKPMRYYDGRIALFDGDSNWDPHTPIEPGWYSDFHSKKDFCPRCWQMEVEEVMVEGERFFEGYVVTKDGQRIKYEW